MDSKEMDCISSKKEGVRAFMDRMRQQKLKADNDCQSPILIDHYKLAQDSKFVTRSNTGLIFDDYNLQHKCEWDEGYPENPERYKAVMNKIRELGLEKRCQILCSKVATNEDILRKHTSQHVKLLENICKERDPAIWEKNASQFDAVYFNNTTYEAAKISVGCAISLVRDVCTGVVQNGLAVTRPPGHHAMEQEYCGYCYFNNVALAAQHALDNKLAKKILIVDWDVHHGQATQQMFYEDDRVLYFSIHRYEYGTFWPNLRESDFDCIGSGLGKGFNCNVPLNDIGFGDNEYMAIFMMVLLPMAYEFSPDLVIVSAGYDAAIGCPEGQMNVSPGCYGHFIQQLSNLAGGKLAVCLEGGYFLNSLGMSAAMTLKALLGDPLVGLKPMAMPQQRCITTINNIRYALSEKWKCFTIMPTYSPDNITKLELIKENKHSVNVLYMGEALKPPHLTRNCYPVQEDAVIAAHNDVLQKLDAQYKTLGSLQTVCYTYDEQMLKHFHPMDARTHEQPLRLSRLYEKFVEYNLHSRCKFVEGRLAKEEHIFLNHSMDYFQYLQEKHEGDLKKFDSVYFNEHTLNCALLSCGSLLAVVDEVMTGKSLSGVAMIRPPGHHADHSTAGGYCFFNNVSIAAKYILNEYNLSRVLIVDWDIHHGNGTQSAFYDDERVLYVSVHRYDDGKFYPKSVEADHDRVGGGGRAVGKNVNVPFSNGKMGNAEYLRAFQDIILPIGYSFAPEMVLVSAGFDAGINDPLGGYQVSPEAFAHFTNMLKPLASGKIVLALEGGYNVETVAYAMTLCTKALLHDPLPPYPLPQDALNENAVQAMRNVISTQSAHWPILKTYKQLPDKISNTFDVSAPEKPSVIRQSICTASKQEENVQSSAENATTQCFHAKTRLQQSVVLHNSHCNVCCKSEPDDLICLICLYVGCSRFAKQHMLDHFEQTGHAVAMHINSSKFWCYECSCQIDGPHLREYKNLAQNIGCKLVDDVCNPDGSDPNCSKSSDV